MADEDRYNNDEYKFSDLDIIGSETEQTNQYQAADTPIPPEPPASSNTRRNIIIAIVLIVLIMLGWKFIGSLFFGHQNDNVDTSTITPATPPPPISQTVPTPPPAQQSDILAINQKLAALALSQQNITSEIATISNQLNSLGANFNELSTSLNNLNQSISNLSNKIDEQTQRMRLLIPKKVVRVSKPVRRKGVASGRYYIQAIIPGRAWLISTNGSTITVREGTVLPGYGVIKLIDSTQGRVLTSSGQIIRFSQQDS